jgi:hypothetical protein
LGDNWRRKLTLDMIRKINAEWKIPIEALTGDCELQAHVALIGGIETLGTI